MITKSHVKYSGCIIQKGIRSCGAGYIGETIHNTSVAFQDKTFPEWPIWEGTKKVDKMGRDLKKWECQKMGRMGNV